MAAPGNQGGNLTGWNSLVCTCTATVRDTKQALRSEKFVGQRCRTGVRFSSSPPHMQKDPPLWRVFLYVWWNEGPAKVRQLLAVGALTNFFCPYRPGRVGNSDVGRDSVIARRVNRRRACGVAPCLGLALRRVNRRRLISFVGYAPLKARWANGLTTGTQFAQPLSLATLASSPARGALYAPFGRQSASLAGEVARRSRDG